MATKYYTAVHPNIGGSGPVLTISPSDLHYGVISNGFVYALKFTVQNNLNAPLKIRPITTPYKTEYEEEEKLDFELPLTDNMNNIKLADLPEKIAPGIRLEMVLELTAEAVCSVQFMLTITQDYNDEVFRKVISAHIVSVDAFKHVKKSLSLQKRPLYRPNVTVIGTTPGFDQYSASAPTLATSNTTLMLMDVDEMEDMTDFPFAPNVYWDPFDKLLRLDPQLGKVYVGGETFEASIAKTNSKRNKRNKQLEEQGFFTRQIIDRLHSEEFDNFRKFGASSYSNSILTEDKYKQEAMEATAEADGADEYEDDDEEEDEDKVEIGDVGPGPPRSNQFPGFESDSSVLSGDTYTMGSHTSQKSMMSVLAMQRAKRQKMEQQRKKSIAAAADFAKSSAMDSTVNPHRTLAIILNRRRNVEPALVPIK